jgi:hypothetical protein
MRRQHRNRQRRSAIGSNRLAGMGETPPHPSELERRQPRQLSSAEQADPAQEDPLVVGCERAAGRPDRARPRVRIRRLQRSAITYTGNTGSRARAAPTTARPVYRRSTRRPARTCGSRDLSLAKRPTSSERRSRSTTDAGELRRHVHPNMPRGTSARRPCCRQRPCSRPAAVATQQGPVSAARASHVGWSIPVERYRHRHRVLQLMLGRGLDRRCWAP